MTRLAERAGRWLKRGGNAVRRGMIVKRATAYRIRLIGRLGLKNKTSRDKREVFYGYESDEF